MTNNLPCVMGSMVYICDYYTGVEIDPKYYRTTEVEELLGDPSKAKNAFKWKPSVSFDDLIEIMIKSDLK